MDRRKKETKIQSAKQRMRLAKVESSLVITNAKIDVIKWATLTFGTRWYQLKDCSRQFLKSVGYPSTANFADSLKALLCLSIFASPKSFWPLLTFYSLFCLFSSLSNHNSNNTNWKKRRWCAWDLNPRPHDGRRRWYYGAMAAALPRLTWCYNFI